MVDAQRILRHRPPGDLQPGFMEGGEQEAGIAIAHEELAARSLGEVSNRGLGDPVRAIAAAREPSRVEPRGGKNPPKAAGALGIRAGEMAFGEEALRMDHKLAIAARV